MDNGELLHYALQKRKLLAVFWLILQQRWFVRFFNLFARGVSWCVIVLGISLVTFTVVTIARDVVPVLTTPGSISNVLLQGVVVIVSFNIYVNYGCATAFSRRIGRAPADYLYHDPYSGFTSARPRDDSDSSKDEEVDERTAFVSSSGREDPPLTEMGRVVPEGPAEATSVGCSSNQARMPDRREDHLRRVPPNVAVGTSDVSRPHTLPGPPPTQSATRAKIYVVRVFEGDAAVNGKRAQEEKRDVEFNTTSRHRQEPSTNTPAATFHACLWVLLSRFSTLVQIVYAKGTSYVVRGCSSVGCSDGCSVASAVCQHADREATYETLHELETMASSAEKLPPQQRAAHVLDTPRRYCHHCRRLKAPREHHCAICNHCVAKMDHHCPWINNCVDIETQRYFLLFVWWLWVGSLLASGFISYGYVRQRSYLRDRDRLHVLWKASPNKVAIERELRALRMPYGPSGVLLTAFPTVLTLGVTVIICVCMTLFIYFNWRLLAENTTVIESIYVDEKRQRVYRSTSHAYRNPYDLGRWFNFLDLFTTADDPLVRVALRAEREAKQLRAATGFAGGVVRRCRDQGMFVCRRAAIILWLTVFPTLRPTHGDGMHYTTYAALVDGEWHPWQACQSATPKDADIDAALRLL